MRQVLVYSVIAFSFLLVSPVALASPGDRATITDPSHLSYFEGTYEMTYCRFCCSGVPVADAEGTFGMDRYGRWVFDDNYGCDGNPYGGGGGSATVWDSGSWFYSFEVEETHSGLVINLVTGGDVDHTYFGRAMTMPWQVMSSGSSVPSTSSYGSGSQLQVYVCDSTVLPFGTENHIPGCNGMQCMLVCATSVEEAYQMMIEHQRHEGRNCRLQTPAETCDWY